MTGNIQWNTILLVIRWCSGAIYAFVHATRREKFPHLPPRTKFVTFFPPCRGIYFRSPSPPLPLTYPTRPLSPRSRYKFTSREQNEKSCFSFVLISPSSCIFVYTRAIFSFSRGRKWGETGCVLADELLYKTSFQQTRESAQFSLRR